jgi:DNA-binding CsgD family transcriptional regulator
VLIVDSHTHAVVQTCYRLDLPDPAWLEQLALSLRPILDHDTLGIVSGFYWCPDPCTWAPGLVLAHGVSDRLQAALKSVLAQLSPAYVAATFLCGGVGPSKCVPDWQSIPPVRDGTLAAAGASDACSIYSAELDGSGIWFMSFRAARVRLANAEWQTLDYLRRQIAAAHRLRRKSSKAPAHGDYTDIRLAPNGRIVDVSEDTALDAEGTHTPASTTQVRKREREPLHNSAEISAPLHVPVRNDSSPTEPAESAIDIDLLSAREREVVEHALSGIETKVIAYDLGLAHSTVRVLLARAAAKLGVNSRRALLDKVARSALAKSGSDEQRSRNTPR